MSIFICTLFFIFMIFLYSVQSMPQPVPPLKPSENNAVVYVNGVSHTGRWVNGVFYPSRETNLKESSECLHQQPPVPVRLLDDGDLLYRNTKPIGKFLGEVPYQTGIEGRPRRVELRNGDLVKRSELPVAQFMNNGFRPYYHQN